MLAGVRGRGAAWAAFARAGTSLAPASSAFRACARDRGGRIHYVGKDGITCGLCGHKQNAGLDGWVTDHLNARTGLACGSSADEEARARQSRARSLTQPTAAKEASSKRSGPKKRPKPKTTQNYCPRCRSYVFMTRLNGVMTVADHRTKRGVRCTMSGRSFTAKRPAKRDALEFRVSGSYGSGKRR